jgi:hypothetical protein
MVCSVRKSRFEILAFILGRLSLRRILRATVWYGPNDGSGDSARANPRLRLKTGFARDDARKLNNGMTQGNEERLRSG